MEDEKTYIEVRNQIFELIQGSPTQVVAAPIGGGTPSISTTNRKYPNLGGPVKSAAAVAAANSFAKSKGGFVNKGKDFTIDFLTDVLNGLGISSPNAYQMNMMKSWRQKEGAKATYNPFNTTRNADGARYYGTNKAGVKNYATRAEGLEQTILTLKQSNFRKILNSIRNINSEADIDNTMVIINNSAWGSNFIPPKYQSYRTLNNYIWGYAND
ncbi:MAG: hypothetical protein ACOVJ8_06260 [Sediminibacterium sp.]